MHECLRYSFIPYINRELDYVRDKRFVCVATTYGGIVTNVKVSNNVKYHKIQIIAIWCDKEIYLPLLFVLNRTCIFMNEKGYKASCVCLIDKDVQKDYVIC